MALFEEYRNHPDPYIRAKATGWAIAIGLQRVNGLNVSDFLIEVACQEIEGKVTMDEAQTLIKAHYTQMNSNRTSLWNYPIWFGCEQNNNRVQQSQTTGFI